MPDPALAHQPVDSTASTVSRRELLLLCVLVAIGFGMRAAHPDRMAVEHFDEGVYASDWFCRPPGLPEGKYPRQYLYAPPLLPEICFWTLFAAGGNPAAVMWINVLAGTLMVPVVWWVARSWFGPAAGLAAAALCAGSEVHAAFSRMVLTDVLLSLFLTAGVAAGVRGVLFGRPVTIAVAGLLAGLAWWTKYNGWLTLAITGAGLGGWLVIDRPRAIAARTLLLRWLTTAAIAVLVWSPAWWGLQSIGGYTVVAENHRRYLVGLSGWWGSLQSQSARLTTFDSRLGLVLGAIGILAACVCVGRGRRATRAACGTVLAATVVLLAVVSGGSATASVLAGVAGLFWRLWQRSELDRQSDDAHPSLGAWTALAWLLGLIVSVPMYTPYPRLALPLVCGSWLGVSALTTCILSWRAGDRGESRHGWLVALAALMGAAVLLGRADHLTTVPETAWEDRTGLGDLAGPIIAAARADAHTSPGGSQTNVQAVLYVFAEPALFYHLSALRQSEDFRFLAQPMGDHALLERGAPDAGVATYIVTGPHADAVARDAQHFSAAVADAVLRIVREWEYRPSALVRLDQPDFAPGTPQRTSVRLYRVR